MAIETRKFTVRNASAGQQVYYGMGSYESLGVACRPLNKFGMPQGEPWTEGVEYDADPFSERVLLLVDPPHGSLQISVEYVDEALSNTQQFLGDVRQFRAAVQTAEQWLDAIDNLDPDAATKAEAVMALKKLCTIVRKLLRIEVRRLGRD